MVTQIHALLEKWRSGHEEELASEYFYRQKLADELAAALRKIEQEDGARNAREAETGALSAWATNIGERLRTQDNRITALPIFAVQQRLRIYGMEDEYSEHVVWLDCCNDYREATPEEHEKFEALHNDGEEVEDWQRTGYRDVWEFVTCCLTEQGCKDYIKVNGHNLKEPRIYAYSGYRNAEWEKLREYFLSHPVPDTAV